MAKQLKQFMAEVKLPKTLTEDFVKLIPEQRELVNKLMIDGKLLSYSLSADRGKLWALFLAESKMEVEEILNDFPIEKYMTYVVSELMFSENSIHKLSQFSMN